MVVYMKTIYFAVDAFLHEIIAMLGVVALFLWVFIDASLNGLQWKHIIPSLFAVFWSIASFLGGLLRDIAGAAASAKNARSDECN